MRIAYNELLDISKIKLTDLCDDNEKLMKKCDTFLTIQEVSQVYIATIELEDMVINALGVSSADGKDQFYCLDKTAVGNGFDYYKSYKDRVRELLINGWTNMPEFIFISEDNLDALMKKYSEEYGHKKESIFKHTDTDDNEDDDEISKPYKPFHDI